MNYYNRVSVLIVILFALNISLISSQRSLVDSIAEQLGFGVKRANYYLDILIEKCDNVEDMNKWILFMDSYLSCDEKTYPKKLSIISEKDSIVRLSELCLAWPRKRACSSRLARKLDSCLGSSLEDGDAGTNGLRLADAHMKFICHHKHEYIGALDPSLNKYGEFLPVDKKPLACFKDTQEHVQECIRREEQTSEQNTFCQKFGLAKKCILKTSRNFCSHEMKDFLETMLGQLAFDLKCETENDLIG